jgi:uncharacterized protein (DUF1800 family)
MISRLLFVCLLIVSLGGLACEKRSLEAREEHVLNRIGYGPDAWSRQRIRQLGIKGYIEEQLYPSRLDDSALEARLRNYYPSLGMNLPQLVSRYDSSTAGRNRTQPRVDAARARILRAVHSKRQLEQVLVEFWYNHFNVDARREIAQWAVIPYERDVIRPRVLGRFEDLLRAVARHPAMLDYLDNAQNFRDGFVLGRDTWGINENFARELLELHTVGNAGQDLDDIRATARAFTGWTIADDLLGLDGRGFQFLSAGHDTSEKHILTLSLRAGGGLSDGDTLIHYLANHPYTAVNIARKLCTRFVSEKESSCVTKAAVRFLSSGGNLREVMREILLSDEFLEARDFRGKVKRPLHAIASLARAVGVGDDRTFAHTAFAELSIMGEEPFGAGPPDGWPDDSSAWLGEGLLLRRFEMAYRATAGSWGFAPLRPISSTNPQTVLDTILQRVLPGGVSSAMRSELLRFLNGIPPAGRLQEGTALVLSGPDFAHH